jgi:hypothetical protein
MGVIDRRMAIETTLDKGKTLPEKLIKVTEGLSMFCLPV